MCVGAVHSFCVVLFCFLCVRNTSRLDCVGIFKNRTQTKASGWIFFVFYGQRANKRSDGLARG